MKYSHNSLIGAGTISNKEVNQDYNLICHLPELEANLILVADGIGSYYRSDFAAQIACEKMKENLEGLISLSELDFADHFYSVVNALKEEIEILKFEGNLKMSFGTTLIACLETDIEFIIAYVGNGSIYHIRGNFDETEYLDNMPWNAINLLSPHSVKSNGQNVLNRFIAPLSSLQQAVPTVIKLSKDLTGSGDILMICTDGISSNDELEIGYDRLGNGLWYYEKKIESFFAKLKTKFISSDLDNLNLSKCLQEYLIQLQKINTIDDDATIALLISDKAKKYILSRQFKNYGQNVD